MEFLKSVIIYAKILSKSYNICICMIVVCLSHCDIQISLLFVYTTFFPLLFYLIYQEKILPLGYGINGYIYLVSENLTMVMIEMSKNFLSFSDIRVL